MPYRTRNKISSSALGYAISFLLLVGLVTSGVLFITATNKRLETNYLISEHILFDNFLSIKQGALSRNNGRNTIIHPTGDTSQVITRSWGAYRVISVSTFHNYHSQESSTIVGYEETEERAALYIPENNSSLRVCGNTKIEGKAFLSEKGIERGYLNGRVYENDELIYGSLGKSEEGLPSLSSDYLEVNYEYFLPISEKIDELPVDSTFSFLNNTSLYSSTSPIEINSSLNGNLVIHSFDSILVASNANIDNIILIAPVIHIESDFNGSLQAYATKKIVCEENVSLSYPSVLSLNSNSIESENDGFIRIGPESRVLGGIKLLAENEQDKKELRLNIENAVVGGLIYNEGETSLLGSVIGHLYTKGFRMKIGGGEFVNYILDSKISSKLLPSEFALPNWLGWDISKPILITCF